jgi:hypothetical protein
MSVEWEARPIIIKSSINPKARIRLSIVYILLANHNSILGK